MPCNKHGPFALGQHLIAIFSAFTFFNHLQDILMGKNRLSTEFYRSPSNIHKDLFGNIPNLPFIGNTDS